MRSSVSAVGWQFSDRCKSMPALSLVCPFYNEAEAMPHFFTRTVPSLQGIEVPFEIVCVKDGSRDDTLALLLNACAAYERIVVVALSRNFGKEAALTAALVRGRNLALLREMMHWRVHSMRDAAACVRGSILAVVERVRRRLGGAQLNRFVRTRRWRARERATSADPRH